MGEGITGTAAERGQTLNVGNALVCEFAEDVEGTADIEESILAVPMRFEGRTVGVIVLSKLGLDQFSVLAVRLLELLAAQAAVSFENARLLEVERRSAQVSQALLEIATRAAAEPSTTAVAEHVCQTVERLTESAGAAVLAHESRSGRHRVVASRGESAVRSIALAAMHTTLPADGEVAVLGIDELPAVTSEASSRALFVAVVPLHRAVLVVAAESFPKRSTDTLAAVARQATLALRNAELLGGAALDAAPAAPA